MKINIITVGKIKHRYYLDAVEEYLKRLSRFAKVQVIEVAEEFYNGDNAGELAVVVKRESDRLASKAKGFVIALDIDGSQLSSQQFAETLSRQTANGVSEFSFLIGGSCGMTEQLKKRADLRISFGKMTYPHQLMRVLLTEQIYRAFTIMQGVPYHK